MWFSVVEETEKTIGVGLSHRRESLISWKSVLKGFLSGSLIVGSIINPFGIVSILLFIIGAYVFIDTVIPFGEDPYPVLTVICAFIGSVIVFIISYSGLAVPYMALVVVITILLYLSKIQGVYSLRTHKK